MVARSTAVTQAGDDGHCCFVVSLPDDGLWWFSSFFLLRVSTPLVRKAK